MTVIKSVRFSELRVGDTIISQVDLNYFDVERPEPEWVDGDIIQVKVSRADYGDGAPYLKMRDDNGNWRPGLLGSGVYNDNWLANNPNAFVAIVKRGKLQ